MKTKYSITIKNSEKELYRIFKELERYGRSTFSYPDKSKRNGISRTISLRGKPLVKRGLFYPPLNNRDSHLIKEPFTAIQLPIGVQISEKKEKKCSRFYFTNRNNIL